MFKNVTANQLNIYISLLIGLFGSISVVFLIMDRSASSLMMWWFSYFLIFFLISFAVNKIFLEKFIFRKIKLIYKTIHDYKSSAFTKRTQIDSNEEIFENLEQDVKDWAENTSKEITELKSLENYRREFVGNVTHELRTPIFTIQGFIHTLLDGALYDEKVNKSYLKKASKNVDRLLNIVNDLEIISKIESGSQLLDMTNFDIKELAEEVFEDLDFMAKSAKVSLMFKKGADASFVVNGDKEAIRQVLINLISNSIKYGKEDGQTKLSFYDMEEYILVEVSDDGIGVENEHIKHLFDRFYRVDKGRSRKDGGSGLGLSIVKHLIEAHNQTINVRSTPGLGSTFGFTLDKVRRTV